MFVNDYDGSKTYDPDREAVLLYGGTIKDEEGVFYTLTWQDKVVPFEAKVEQFDLGSGGPWELVWTVLELGRGIASQQSFPLAPPSGGWGFRYLFPTAEEEWEFAVLIKEALTAHRAFFGLGKGDVRDVRITDEAWQFKENAVRSN